MALCTKVKYGEILKIGEVEILFKAKFGNYVGLVIMAPKEIPIKRIKPVQEKKDAVD